MSSLSSSRKKTPESEQVFCSVPTKMKLKIPISPRSDERRIICLKSGFHHDLFVSQSGRIFEMNHENNEGEFGPLESIDFFKFDIPNHHHFFSSLKKSLSAIDVIIYCK